MNHSLIPNRFHKMKRLIQVMSSINIWQENQPIFLQYLWFYASELQLIFIILWSQLTFLTTPSDDTFVEFLRNYSKYLSLHEVITEEAGSTSKRYITYALFIYYLLVTVIVQGITIKKYLTGKIARLEHLLVVHISKSFFELVFWPANYFLIYSVSSQGNPYEIFSGFSNESLGYRIFVIFGICSTNITALVFSVMNFDPVKTNNPFALRKTTYQILGFIYKAIMAPIFIFQNQEDVVLGLIVGLSLIMGIARRIIIIRQLPYYHVAAMKSANIFSVFIIVLNVSYFLSRVISGTEKPTSISLVYIQMLVIVIGIKFSSNYLKKSVDDYMKIDLSRTHSEKDVLARCFAYTYLINEAKTNMGETSTIGNPALVFLMAELSKNNDFSTNDLSLLKQKEKIQQFHSRKISECFLEGINRIKNNDYLKIIYAYGVLRNEENYAKAYALMSSVKRQKLSRRDAIVHETLNERMEEELHTFYQNNELGMMNLRNVIDYEEYNNQISTEIISIFDLYLNFWEIYSSSNLHMSQLSDLSYQIELKSVSVDKLWNKYIQKFPENSKKLAHLYCTYLLIIKNQAEKAKAIKEKLKIDGSLFDDIWEDSDSNENGSIITVSFDEDNMGKIQYANSAIGGISEKDLCGKTVFDLMPASIRQGHTQLIKKFNQKYDYKFIPMKDISTFIKNSNGFISAGEVSVSLYPYMMSDLRYICFIKKTTDSREYILVSEDGVIEGCTEKFGARLNLSPQTPIKITEICSGITSKELSNFSSEKISAGEEIKKFLKFTNQKLQAQYLVSSVQKELGNVKYFILKLSSLEGKDLVEDNEEEASDNFQEQLLDENPSYSLHQAKVPKIKTLLDFAKLDHSEKNDDFVKVQKISKKRTLADVRDTNSTASRSTRSEKSRLEGAIYGVPKLSFLQKLLKVGSFGYILICVIFLISLLAFRIENITEAKDNIEIMSIATARLFQFLRVIFSVKNIDLIEKGILENDRFSSLVPVSYDFIEKDLSSLGAQTLVKYNNLLRESIYVVEEKYLPTFFQEILVYEGENFNDTSTEDTFSLSGIIATKTMKINLTSSENMHKLDYDIRYILKNSFNDLLTSHQKIFDILEQDTQAKLESSGNLVVIFMVLVIVIGIFDAGFLIKELRNIITIRNQFVEIFLRIDSRDIRDRIEEVKSIKLAIQEHREIRESELNLAKTSRSRLFSKLSKEKVKGNYKRLANMAGMNKWAYEIFFWRVIWTVLFLLCFGSIRILASQQDEIILKKYEHVVEFNRVFYDEFILGNAIAAYFESKGEFQIENTPSGEYLETLYNRLSEKQDFFNDILEDTKNETIKTLIGGNVCEVLKLDVGLNFCPILVSGSLTKGLIALNSYLTAFFRRMKDSYDFSNHSIEVVKELLNEQSAFELEIAVSGFIFAAYPMMEAELKKEFSEEIINSKGPLQSLIIPYLLIIIIAGSLLSLKIARDIRHASMLWRYIIRIIPHKAIYTNKLLEVFLLQKSRSIIYEKKYFHH